MRASCTSWWCLPAFRPGAGVALAGAIILTACAYDAREPDLIEGSLVISRPVTGISAVYAVGPVANRRIADVYFLLPRDVQATLGERYGGSGVWVHLDAQGNLPPFTIGSSVSPVLSGDMIVASPWVGGLMAPIVGATVSLSVP